MTGIPVEVQSRSSVVKETTYTCLDLELIDLLDN